MVGGLNAFLLVFDSTCNI